MRGTATDSFAARARRSALESTFSRTEIGRRWETPERLSTRLFLAREERELLDHLPDVLRQLYRDRRRTRKPGLLPGDFEALFDGRGVVGTDFTADAVLKRGDDLPA